MGHFESIKAAIDAKVNTNGRQAITGHILNNILHGMLDSIDVALADEVKKILGDVSLDYDTLKEIADYIATDKKQYAEVLEALNAINISLTTKVDKTAYDATIANINSLFSALSLTIQTLSNEIAELNKRVAALEGNKTSNLVGSAKVGYALVG